ncbi:uncharacterized protein BDV17DRAFT_167002 [Aspergillus undulatus]|uniref:uncharacterized protein n=1 Tax=Aspergillus undulatus TaxID=1810928 RepID=UPI003CCD82FB
MEMAGLVGKTIFPIPIGWHRSSKFEVPINGVDGLSADHGTQIISPEWRTDRINQDAILTFVINSAPKFEHPHPFFFDTCSGYWNRILRRLKSWLHELGEKYIYSTIWKRWYSFDHISFELPALAHIFTHTPTHPLSIRHVFQSNSQENSRWKHHQRRTRDNTLGGHSNF